MKDLKIFENKKIQLLLLIFCFLSFTGKTTIAQNLHPHILVKEQDKKAILEKTLMYAWADTILHKLHHTTDRYVDKHISDPQWILSRYQMNRVPGKRYTHVYAQPNGLAIDSCSGDAPFPTVKIPSHVRVPVTDLGGSYRSPRLEEVVPNDTSQVMFLTNLDSGKKEWIDPHSFTGSINSEINNLALNAAILYWLSSDEKYARFAADILNQWANGAYYQMPIVGPCRTGYLNLQTLGDQTYKSLILAYDFVAPFMKQNGYDLSKYETVFERFASTLAARGFWNNNWYAAESSAMVFAALSLENKTKRDYYLQFYLSKDTINGACGQLALPSTVKNWLTPDGHWKEPGGYHNFPVSNLLISALAMENNGYPVFKDFPALFQASYAMLKYSFPNLSVGAFGDTGRASQSPESLEIGLIGAVKYKEPQLPEMLASMKQLIAGGMYERVESGYLGLLCFLPELPAVESNYSWPRSGSLDFAKLIVQRNGMNPQTGLMYGVQGASYNHNHCNGMAMELYGCGEIMGIDAGKGITYEHPLHVNYYSQWAAHNTVVAGGSSSSVPFAGSAGRKDIGQIEIAAMEPLPDQKAVSPNYSFTDTRYLDRSTNTNQSRTMAIIRTSETTGYYVDIYRSDNQTSNDYVYHNIGDKVTFLNSKREELKTTPAKYPLTGKDYPGFRFYTEVQKLDNFNGNLISLFSIKDEKSNDLFMQVLLPGTDKRTYYQAMSLRTHTAGERYNNKPVPLFTIRDTSESKTKPFIAIFEPYKGKDGYNVDKITVDQRKDGGKFTAISVFNRDSSHQILFQSVNGSEKYIGNQWQFSGFFGVAGIQNDRLTTLYLGKGQSITHSGYTLKSSMPNGSANLILNKNSLYISCNQHTEVGIPYSPNKKYYLKSGDKTVELKTVRSGNQIVFEIAAVNEGIISFKCI